MMKRFGWVAWLLLLGCWASGCEKSPPDKPIAPPAAQTGTSAADTQADESAPAAKGETSSGGRVAGAMGKALLRAVAGPPQQPPRDEAPPFQP